MPGRLLSNLVRSSEPHAAPFTSRSSSTTSVNDSPGSSGLSSKRNSWSLPVETHDNIEHRITAAMEHLMHPSKEKRIGLGRSSRSKERKGPKDVAGPKLDVVIESPPLVFYGTPANSSGALFSGRLRVTVSEQPGTTTLKEFSANLTKTFAIKKPISKDCPNCSSRKDTLKEWKFLTESVTLNKGDHDFPISYLFPGDLPASAAGNLGVVEYWITARAVTSTGAEIVKKIPLTVHRAILPGNDRASVRIFPPTNLTGRVILPSVVHPIGAFPVQMSLSGVVEKGEDTQTRWRLRKMMWRIEEHQKVVASACTKHAHKIGGEGKGVLHQETRIIGHNEEKNGWKTDFDTAGGEINMEFLANIKPGSKPICDLDIKGHLEVKHNLVIELIVAEEFCPNRNTKLITPTGAARVLRMQFNLLVTERSGLGISWDEEQPPVYNDVPASPPGYSTINGGCEMEDYNGSPLPELPDYEGLERMDRSDTSSYFSGLSRERSQLTADDLTAEPDVAEARNHADAEGPEAVEAGDVE
jgi:arrestin-related trafficking adapter 1